MSFDAGLSDRWAHVRTRPSHRDTSWCRHVIVRDAMRDFSGAIEMTRSGFEHRRGREPLEPVGAGREYGGNAVPPAGAGVRDSEGAVAQQGLDPRPLAAR